MYKYKNCQTEELNLALNMPLHDGAVNDINTALSTPDTFNTEMKSLGKLQDVLSGNHMLNINVSHQARFRFNKNSLILCVNELQEYFI